MEYISNTLHNLWLQTAFTNMTIGNLIMIVVALFFLYLAIRWDFEPLLLIPISFGMLLVSWMNGRFYRLSFSWVSVQ